MFTLMRNLLINQKRRGKIARRHAERAQAEAVHSAAPTQVTTIFLAQTLSALDGLGAEEHEAVRLLGVEERTYEEAASALGLPLGTLKSRLFRARAKLRARLDLEDADALAPDNPAAAA
jgi:RNA polymerase sigma-70 factor (ECF subfamily)